ncbi:MAG: hypothetical protein GC162_18815 [Planctomycetes bacterium]|nr:hypothetical protein [Planctomycetota bacterium]
MRFDAQIGSMLSAYLEGSLEADQFGPFESWLNADRDHAALLIEQTQLARLLRQTLHDAAFADAPVAIPAKVHGDRAVARSPRWRFVAGAIAAAMAIVALGWATRFMAPATDPPKPPSGAAAPVAVLLGAENVVWDSEHRNIGETLAKQTLRIASGSMNLQLWSGATVMLQGPAEFAIDGPAESHLTYGRVLIEAGAHAAGFTVHTPHFDVVDLGTAFTIDVDREGEGHVSVLQGVVEVYSRDDVRRLRANEQVQFTRGAGLSMPQRTRADVSADAADYPPVQSAAAVAIDKLFLLSKDRPRAPGSDLRSMFTQTLSVDPQRRLAYVQFVLKGVGDVADDAEFGIYALTLTNPLGIAQSIPLIGRFNRDTIVMDADSAADAGWRHRNEWFTAASFPARLFTVHEPTELVTDDHARYALAPIGANKSLDAWVMNVGTDETLEVEPGRYVRLSVLYSAVGFNPIQGKPDDARIILHYDNGTTQTLDWDLADSTGAGRNSTRERTTDDKQ